MREVPKALITAKMSKGILQQAGNIRSEGKNIRDVDDKTTDLHHKWVIRNDASKGV